MWVVEAVEMDAERGGAADRGRATPVPRTAGHEEGEAAVRGSVEDAELDLDLHHRGGEDRGG
jgi:hypothetical protein